MLSRLLFFIGVIFFLAGCETKSVSKQTYLDIDSLIDVQIKNLTLAGAHVEKTAVLGNTSDQSQFVPDSTGWSSELDVFRELNTINKPIYKDQYVITDGEKDSNSNLIIRTYQAKDDLPVRSLSLYYYKSLNSIKKLKAVYNKENILYSTERTLTMNFDEVKGKHLLADYSVSGIQKMIVSDTVRFSITCHIIF